MSDETRAEIVIVGRVQGVGFRWHTQRQGQSLGLRGWVSNDSDGSVRALAQGPRGAVERFVRWCRSGPTSARVEDLSVHWIDPIDDLDESFTIRG